MGRLRAAFASIDDDLQDACFQRGLLPRHITESLRMARFLSITLPSARAAQNETGVPSSILLAEAFEISGPSMYGCNFELARPDSNDIFNTRRKFKSMDEAFSARAHWLTQQPSFKQVMRATGDATLGFTQAAYPSNFMDLIAAWSKPKYGDQLVETISAHNLLECDRMVPVL
jgi:flagellum-specific peptidoglycan hydrolase FlgJ